MDKLQTNKCLIKVRFKCPSIECVDEKVQQQTTDNFKIGRDGGLWKRVKCEDCGQMVRLNFN